MTPSVFNITKTTQIRSEQQESAAVSRQGTCQVSLPKHRFGRQQQPELHKPDSSFFLSQDNASRVWHAVSCSSGPLDILGPACVHRVPREPWYYPSHAEPEAAVDTCVTTNFWVILGCLQFFL